VHAREARARRALGRLGQRLSKDRARTWNIDHFGGYMITDAHTNVILSGARWDLSLEAVEQWVAAEQAAA
jgi:hypothetical protein